MAKGRCLMENQHLTCVVGTVEDCGGGAIASAEEELGCRGHHRGDD